MEQNKERTNDAHTAHALEHIAKDIPQGSIKLKNDLRASCVFLGGILPMRTAAHAKLMTERLRMRHPKDKEYTDWDRKLMLDANTSDAQAAYDTLAGIEKALEVRIAAVQALLVQ